MILGEGLGEGGILGDGGDTGLGATGVVDGGVDGVSVPKRSPKKTTKRIAAIQQITTTTAIMIEVLFSILIRIFISLCVTRIIDLCTLRIEPKIT